MPQHMCQESVKSTSLLMLEDIIVENLKCVGNLKFFFSICQCIIKTLKFKFCIKMTI